MLSSPIEPVGRVLPKAYPKQRTFLYLILGPFEVFLPADMFREWRAVDEHELQRTVSGVLNSVFDSWWGQHDRFGPDLVLYPINGSDAGSLIEEHGLLFLLVSVLGRTTAWVHGMRADDEAVRTHVFLGNNKGGVAAVGFVHHILHVFCISKQVLFHNPFLHVVLASVPGRSESIVREPYSVGT